MVKRNVGARYADGFDEEREFSCIGFNEVLIGRPKNGGYEARKSRATAEIGPSAGRNRRVAEQLGRIEDMPAPNFGQAIFANEVDASLPPIEQRHELLESLHIFVGDTHFVAKFVGPVGAPLRIAFHVKRRQ